MAWTAPATFTTGNVLTAAQMNTNVRDNTNYLFDQPMAMITNTANVSVANNVQAIPSMPTTSFSSPGITITGASAKFLPTFSGTFAAWANLTWAANATGVREAGIFSFGEAVHIGYAVATPGVNAKYGVSIAGTSGILNGTTHYLQLQVAQSSGGALNIEGDGTPDSIIGQQVPFRFAIKMLGTGS